MAATVDAHGNTVIAGFADVPDLATPEAAQHDYRGGGAAGGADGFVMKYGRNGQLLWFTYLGSSDYDVIQDVAITAGGAIAFVGYTFGSDFPVRRPFQRYHPSPNETGARTPQPDVVVGVLDPTGTTLRYSSYLGSPGSDRGLAIKATPTGAVVVMGDSVTTPEEPRTIVATPGAYHIGDGTGRGDAVPTSFVARIGPAFTVEWIATLGLTRQATAAEESASQKCGCGFMPRRLDLSAGEDVFIAGQTPPLPQVPTTPGSYRPTGNWKAGTADYWAARLSPDGRRLVWATLVGSLNGNDRFADVVATQRGLYLYGSTDSASFPQVKPVQQCPSDGASAIAQLTLDGRRLALSSCFGGGQEVAQAAARDASGNVFLTGMTSSENFPRKRAAQRTVQPNGDCYLAEISARGSLLWSTPLGGMLGECGGPGWGEDGVDVAVRDGAVVLLGTTASPNFPGIPTREYLANGAKNNPFISRVSPAGSLVPDQAGAGSPPSRPGVPTRTHASRSPGPQLATTGLSDTQPALGAGLVLVALGLGLLRRRRHKTHF
jgi:MYXO-CTERM domain-containing protein